MQGWSRDQEGESAVKELNVCLMNDSFPPLIDGVATTVTNYARIITQNHGRATVITPTNPAADDSVFSFPVLRYPSVDTTKFAGYRAGLPFSPEIQHRLINEGFDVIHSHSPVSSLMFARSLRYKLNAPIIFTYHTKYDIDIEKITSNKLLQKTAQQLLLDNICACDEVWTVSAGAGENMHEFGYQGDYVVMPNGIDFPAERVDDDLIDQITEGYDLPRDLPVFMFVGRIMWYKGIKITIDSLKMLLEKGQDFRMVFVGAGTDKDAIVAYTNESGLSGKVLFTPPIHDREALRAWYCRADMFLFPSTYDTNGLVVREAAACELGSVLIKGSCAAKDVTDGVNGCLIDENAEAMAAKLIELCNNTEAMHVIGKAAQPDLYLSWDQAVANAVERYMVVIDNYHKGLSASKRRLTDESYRAAAEAMDVIALGHEMQKNRTTFMSN